LFVLQSGMVHNFPWSRPEKIWCLKILRNSKVTSTQACETCSLSRSTLPNNSLSTWVMGHHTKK
jgi:hypothetical protein